MSALASLGPSGFVDQREGYPDPGAPCPPGGAEVGSGRAEGEVQGAPQPLEARVNNVYPDVLRMGEASPESAGYADPLYSPSPSPQLRMRGAHSGDGWAIPRHLGPERVAPIHAHQGSNPLSNIKGIPLIKLIVLALVITGLVIGAVFTGMLTSSLIARGAFLWQVCLAGGGCAILGLGALASIFTANETHMFEDTGDNMRDSAAFAALTTFSVFYGLYQVAKIGVCIACAEALCSR